MRKFYLLIIVVLTGLSACNKSDKTSSSANFNITGIHDVDLSSSSSSSFTLPIAIVSTGSSTDTVDLSVGDLPPGLTVDFSPSHGYTPFASRVTFSYDYTGTGGTYPITITGNGHSGSRSYTLNVTLGNYRGWQFGGVFYNKTGLSTNPGNATQYPNILVTGGGAGRLTINFGRGKSLPTKNKTYTITSSSDTGDNIQLTMQDVTMIYISTGKSTNSSIAPTGTFTFDTLGKFTFKCSDVEMTDGLGKQTLSASFSQ